MFETLFLKECKQIAKSMVYYIYVVVFVLFLTSQFSSGLTDYMQEPKPGKEHYGSVISHEASVVIEKTLAALALEACNNSFSTYPLGFYKGVTLNEQEEQQVKSIVEQCTGKSWDQTLQEMERHFSGYERDTMQGALQAQTSYSVVPKEDLSYEEFCGFMEKVCAIVGPGSSYRKESLEAGVSVPMTYEQAKEEFEDLCSKDQITGAAARLFCDYAGIILAVLPIFLGVTRCLRDKRAQVSQVVYAHKASALHIIGSRYFANVFMAFFPVTLTAFVIQMPYQYHAKTIGVAPDILAFLKYSLVWLLPEIMAVLAVSFLITEFTENVISIFIQVFWALGSLFSTVTLSGDFGLKLTARWNLWGGAREFWLQRKELFLNRGFYFGLALTALAVTVVIFEKKRREGETLYGKVFKRRR